MRYFLNISFKGTNYHGWQIQENAITVQELVQKALTIALRQTTAVMGCGRTDTGVHSSQFYLNFDGEIDPQKDFIYKINALLPNDIVARQLIPLHDEAHTRFDAISRTYQYFIHQELNPFLMEFSAYFKDSLDISKMNLACNYLLGEKDFSCFSKSKTQTKTNVCNVTEAFWEIKNEQLVFTISANRFLRNMVRAIVGTLLEIGRSKKEPEHIKEVLLKLDRKEAGVSAPAHGLFLTAVKYPYALKPMVF